jgi:predicted lipid-binding transport protein (Tim44 family)
MKQSLLTLVAAALTFTSLGFFAADAEAKRLGGGSSFGMKRSVTPSQPAVAPKPAQQAAPTAAAPAAAGATGAAAAGAGKRSWLGPVAGLAAGLGLAALASHLGFGEEMASLMMVLLLVGGAFFLFRLLTRSRQPQGAFQYAGAAAGTPRTEPLHFDAEKVGAGTTAATSPATRIPADFDAEGFLRQAKLNFLRLQAANDRGDMDDIKRFVTPEVFAEIQMQYEERGRTGQETDVVQLDAALLEVVTETDQHVVSVRFSGLLREEAAATVEPLNEIWHLTKPLDGSRGWQIAGIQQVA